MLATGQAKKHETLENWWQIGQKDYRHAYPIRWVEIQQELGSKALMMLEAVLQIAITKPDSLIASGRKMESKSHQDHIKT